MDAQAQAGILLLLLSLVAVRLPTPLALTAIGILQSIGWRLLITAEPTKKQLLLLALEGQTMLLATTAFAAGCMLPQSFLRPICLGAALTLLAALLASYPITANFSLQCAIVTALALPFATSWRSFAVLVACLTPVMIAQESMGSAVVTTAAAFVKLPRKAKLAALASTLVLSPWLVKLFFQHESGRLEMWRAALMVYAEHPLAWFVGFGAGSGPVFLLDAVPYLQRTDLYWFNLHNDWLELAFWFGIPTMLAFTWFFVQTAQRARQQEQLLLVGFGALSLLYFPAGTPLGLTLECLVLGMVCAVTVKPRRRPQDRPSLSRYSGPSTSAPSASPPESSSGPSCPHVRCTSRSCPSGTAASGPR